MSICIKFEEDLLQSVFGAFCVAFFFNDFGLSLNELNLNIKNKIGSSCTTFFEKSLANKVRMLRTNRKKKKSRHSQAVPEACCQLSGTST